ncbi:chromosome (plasmid) partitioning protein ParB [Sulfuriferula multivorans]|uniref:Chromosome (Plasmid) partitioning protein ParB n=1 Tax=Sulfuriferula multivorans TaxID=1559896 RepID=A0A401JB50_9PROT|nr:ParB/RepB/Spo0J family partition protein [Sulfuriferula multivorans]GBL44898.1 chromosome (plasmid) partitioning protein ParB [Sulfuriferula multivorans]
MARLKGLGRGLDALLGGEDAPALPGELRNLTVTQLQPGKYQPRTRMDEASLRELADSIKSQGLMQPILVRAVGAERYEIIAGERRWRAAQLAGMSTVPVVVKVVPDEAALAMALIENIQREDLNPMEEATGIQRLIDEFNMTHQAAAEAVGRSRSAVTNLLRLLNLAKPVQAMVLEQQLDMGHARALLALTHPKQNEAAHMIVQKQLSVRETERLVGQLLNPPITAIKKIDRDIQRLEENLSDRLGTRVNIQSRKGGAGKLTIEYASHEQLEGILSKL